MALYSRSISGGRSDCLQAVWNDFGSDGPSLMPKYDLLGVCRDVNEKGTCLVTVCEMSSEYNADCNFSPVSSVV